MFITANSSSLSLVMGIWTGLDQSLGPKKADSGLMDPLLNMGSFNFSSLFLSMSSLIMLERSTFSRISLMVKPCQDPMAALGYSLIICLTFINNLFLRFFPSFEFNFQIGTGSFNLCCVDTIHFNSGQITIFSVKEPKSFNFTSKMYSLVECRKARASVTDSKIKVT